MALNQFAAGQWVEKVRGDSSKPGEPLVIRIHNDAGYLVPPHYHLTDENITVVKGSWALGSGKKFDKFRLEPMKVGTFGIAPPLRCLALQQSLIFQPNRGFTWSRVLR